MACEATERSWQASPPAPASPGTLAPTPPPPRPRHPCRTHARTAIGVPPEAQRPPSAATTYCMAEDHLPPAAPPQSAPYIRPATLLRIAPALQRDPAQATHARRSPPHSGARVRPP